MSKIYKR